MSSLQNLIANNRAWAARIEADEPGFFARLTAQQAPRYLWIGCSDSRVPANDIVGLLPGELFVHRNVANVVVHTDLNCLSVLQFAVDVLRVQHVIVCGHYGCGGVRAAWSAQPLGLIENWLRHIQDVAGKHTALFEGLASDAARVDRLCELNVIEQVMHVCRTTVVQDAWHRGQAVAVHGWIYELADGLVRELGIAADGPVALDNQYKRALAALAKPGGVGR